jgi:hypothetical protein
VNIILPGQGQKEHINLANNQISHNTKMKSGNQNHQLACQKQNCTVPSRAIRRSVNNSPKKKIQHKIQWEMKKMDTLLLTSLPGRNYFALICNFVEKRV